MVLPSFQALPISWELTLDFPEGNTGKLPRFALSSTASDAALVKVYGQDGSVLSRLKTRSEFRKLEGLVKMGSGEIDERTLGLDAE